MLAFSTGGNDPGDLDTILRLEREKEKFHKKLADDEVRAFYFDRVAVK